MSIPLPSSAYVPGKTPRPDEGVFDHIRDTAKAGMSADALARSDAFRHGLAYLEAGFFWEAHEVLEPVWMALPEGADRRFVQGVIQLANALLKERMERPKAALRLAGMSRDLIGDAGPSMGCDRDTFVEKIDALADRLSGVC